MEDVKLIIAKNLVALRKSNNLTQQELAERLNYSDKSISKWERGEGIPDVETLISIAELYEVTLDYLIKSEHPKIQTKKQKRKHFIISLISISGLWVAVIMTYALLNILAHINLWEIVFGGYPLSVLLALIFNCIWGKKRYLYFFLTMLIWGVMALLYMIFREKNIWQMFLIGIPLQVTVVLWFLLDKNNKKD